MRILQVVAAMMLSVMLTANSLHAASSVSSEDLFGHSAVQMTEQEMAETNGEWGPLGAVVNAAVETGIYVVEKKVSGEKITLGGVAGAAAKGAIVGAVAGPAAGTAIRVARNAKRAKKASKAIRTAARKGKNTRSRNAIAKYKWKTKGTKSKARKIINSGAKGSVTGAGFYTVTQKARGKSVTRGGLLRNAAYGSARGASRAATRK